MAEARRECNGENEKFFCNFADARESLHFRRTTPVDEQGGLVLVTTIAHKPCHPAIFGEGLHDRRDESQDQG
ncbi:hypothetical protein [Aminobacter sp. AP02]|uniref:hypothetical protein n=1 Tax=Aminobacter sp. AP02 TaxID=2135737 RepID=UPI0011B221B4|nr:hypothetical protein [Aminobacter sp. AP02]